MLVFITDAKTVLAGASSGIDICIKTVIPSLFPFFILSTLLSNSMQGQSISCLRPLGKLCGIPEGAESLLLLGVCGGYPVGAKCLYDAYSCRTIHRKDAQRMLGFCSNAGPSFIFGMTAALFNSVIIPWILWGIQIISMIMTGMILPNKSNDTCGNTRSVKMNNPMIPALKAMATVCGWIVMMRVMIFLLNRWILWCLPEYFSIAITGVIELSNGCLEMHGLENSVLRYILLSVFLSFGGVCVLFQTYSLIGDLGIRYYVIGKLMQTTIAVVLAFLTVPIVFPGNKCFAGCAVSAAICTGFVVLIRMYFKNNTGNYAPHAV